MKYLILRKLLVQYGFKSSDFELFESKITFKIRDVNQQELREEGSAIPNKNDCYYHNYFYPAGFIANIEKIKIDLYPEGHRFKNRIKMITFPVDLYKNPDNTAEIIVSTANLICGTQHQIAQINDHLQITLDYSTGRGSDDTKYLLNQLIAGLEPRTADKDEIRAGVNYVSDLARIFPLILPEIKKEATQLLINPQGDKSLLQLSDRVVSSAEHVAIRAIELDIHFFFNYIEKMVREEGYLAQLIRKHLKLDQKNWFLADQNLLRNVMDTNNSNEAKFKLALEKRQEPLYISTTTGNHAFAVTVDFNKDTLFIANPGGDLSNCEEIIQLLKKITGYEKVISVLTKTLPRQDDIPFNDLCTVDSLVLAHMMMDSPDSLSEGCLNNRTLKTGTLIKLALENTDSAIVDNSAQTPVSPVIQQTEQPQQAIPSGDSNSSNLNFWILSGFMAAVGAAALLLTFTVLNATTLGLAGIMVGAVAVATPLVGLGIFACKKYSNYQLHEEAALPSL